MVGRQVDIELVIDNKKSRPQDKPHKLLKRKINTRHLQLHVLSYENHNE
jgi:hypothetical protein